MFCSRWPTFTYLLWKQTPNLHWLGTHSSALAQLPRNLQHGCEKWNRTNPASQLPLAGACKDMWLHARRWNNHCPVLVMGQWCCQAVLINAWDASVICRWKVIYSCKLFLSFMWSLLFPGVPHFDSCHIPYLAQGRFLSVEVVLYISSCLHTVQVCDLLSTYIRGSLSVPMLGKLGLEFAQNCNTWADGLAGGFRGAAFDEYWAGYSAGLCTQLCKQSEDQMGEPERRKRNILSFCAWDCPREGEEAREDQTGAS